MPGINPGRSGAGLLEIATQSGNLIAELGRAMAVAAGEGNGEGELQLFELVISLNLGAGLQVAAIAGLGEGRGTLGAAGHGTDAMSLGMGWGSSGVGRGVSHGSLSSYFDTNSQEGDRAVIASGRIEEHLVRFPVLVLLLLER